MGFLFHCCPFPFVVECWARLFLEASLNSQAVFLPALNFNCHCHVPFRPLRAVVPDTTGASDADAFGGRAYGTLRSVHRRVTHQPQTEFPVPAQPAGAFPRIQTAQQPAGGGLLRKARIYTFRHGIICGYQIHRISALGSIGSDTLYFPPSVSFTAFFYLYVVYITT